MKVTGNQLLTEVSVEECSDMVECKRLTGRRTDVNSRDIKASFMETERKTSSTTK